MNDVIWTAGGKKKWGGTVNEPFGRLRKVNLYISGRRTSFTLEPVYKDELVRIAREQGRTLNKLVNDIDVLRPSGVGLASAVRQYVLSNVKAQVRND